VTELPYEEFLASKRMAFNSVGIDVNPNELPDYLFMFQKDIVSWALRKGRACVFADCGLGKTRVALSWANTLLPHCNKPFLILAPLAVAHQTKREGDLIGVNVNICRSQSDVKPGINITNYEMLHHFNASEFDGVVLDESSILKGMNSKTCTAILDAFAATPYKLACTATPAPNDYMELGTHAEFVGVMSRTEMLSMFFVHDGGETSKWRLKGHAETEYWKWIASWAVTIMSPHDLGYPDDGFKLPQLHYFHHCLDIDSMPTENLIETEALTLNDQRQSKRNSLKDRVSTISDLVARNVSEQWLIWCELNIEGDALEKTIPGSVQVSGSDTQEFKEQAIIDFIEGRTKVLISKSSIFGFGLNLQCCARIGFVGISHSFEQTYQAIRRCWRFGQSREVECHMVYARAEEPIVKNLKRKQKDAEKMQREMIKHIANMAIGTATVRDTTLYNTEVTTNGAYTAYKGDCVDVVAQLPDNSIDFSVYSPPFASLYTYSASDRDMGNTKSDEDFFQHYAFLVKELYRALKPGRLVSVHCMNLPRIKEREGVIGIKDFRGDIIRLHEEMGFVYHSEVCIWKDPVTAMQRTKALGLLHKQIVKDSAMSRQGIPDYLITFRKDGVNDNPVKGEFETYIGDETDAEFDKWCKQKYEQQKIEGNTMPYHTFKSVNIWQRYASPVWMDINPSNTLQRESAREDNDERHICPLQIQVIERALDLWTLPGDTVLSPFMGIGSEGVVSIRKGRKFIGAELKSSYYTQAVLNLENAIISSSQQSLFGDIN